jgi:hypothetical protein
VLKEKAPKKPIAKAAAAIKDSVVAGAKPEAKARASKDAPLLAIEGREQPKTRAPPKSGPLKGKKPTIRVLPLTTAVSKEGTALKPKGKALVAPSAEPEFA